ncbi:cardiolipin synthase [Xylanibacillus composti]|uniref:Cardiolipin synthase n=1 Tax=Xylanibacillus composti TaxID=1572762 RepID=A0A8J4H672_9BACL|nr:cardiolipin synthase [Xylanibacillus composti]MDT9725833.1 cardiolipin synthase [Xylanibacillus composti]GIQ69213.1 cardiolipin synthase [Xylanibacillus composti]
MVWLTSILCIYLFQIVTIVLLEYRRPSKAVAWLIILFIFPLIGFVMYYFLAQEYKKRKLVRKKEKQALNLDEKKERVYTQEPESAASMRSEFLRKEPRLFRLLDSFPEAPITCRNETTVLTNAEKTYAAMLQAMEQAQHHIHVESYIVRDDIIGRTFRDVLERKSREGVEVRVIVDGVGSYHLPSDYLLSLRRAGANAEIFLPPSLAFFDKRMNYRNHRKIVVVDGRVGFVGGINIGDEHLGADAKLGFWRDTHLRIIGEAVHTLQDTFLTDWFFVSGETVSGDVYVPPYAGTGEEEVQIITSGPDKHWDAILEMYFAAICAAREKVYLTTPYFIPDASIGMALKVAAASGADVRIIIPGTPDSKLVHWASLSYLEELMEAGVRFYQYQKGFVHAKTMVVDDMLASVGTANLDLRSFFSNFELNAVLFHGESIRRLAEDFAQDLRDSKQVTLEAFRHRPRLARGREMVARLLSPLL